jgi:hypothetical protein
MMFFVRWLARSFDLQNSQDFRPYPQNGRTNRTWRKLLIYKADFVAKKSFVLPIFANPLRTRAKSIIEENQILSFGFKTSFLRTVDDGTG